MGIIGFSQSPIFSVLLAPLQAVVTFFAPWCREGADSFDAPSQRLHGPATGKSRMQGTAGHSDGACTATRQAHSAVMRPSYPSATHCNGASRSLRNNRLRVVRELDADVAASCAGRMVISGRMADVCAELDRMAQREAANC